MTNMIDTPSNARGTVLAAILAGSVAASLPALAQQPTPRAPMPSQQNMAGTLTCDISAGLGLIVGSSRSMACTYSPSSGRPETYTGTIRRFGLDLGVTAGAQLVWVVLTSGDARRPGSLAGDYVGATADASLGLGAGANLLVGGSNRTVSLQPLSVQAQTGVNVAAGVSQLSLARAR